MDDTQKFNGLVVILVHCLNNYSGKFYEVKYDYFIDEIEKFMNENQEEDFNFKRGFITACSAFMQKLSTDDKRLEEAFSAVVEFQIALTQ